MLCHRIWIPLFLLSTAVHSGEREWFEFVTASPGAGVQQPAATHSAKKGLLLSAVVPGAGQFYSGSKLKAGVFLAVEAACWAVYVHHRGLGNDIEDEFHLYADTHWSEDEYWDWIYEHAMKDPDFQGSSRSDLEALRAWEHDNFSHGLHREKDQQYYEMIGKYDQFNYGWDDSDIGLLDSDWDKSKRSARRLYYEERRDASNRAFKTATTGVTLVLVNHILSAIEAAWSIKVKNDRILSARMNVRPLNLGAETAVPALTLTMNW